MITSKHILEAFTVFILLLSQVLSTNLVKSLFIAKYVSLMSSIVHYEDYIFYPAKTDVKQMNWKTRVAVRSLRGHMNSVVALAVWNDQLVSFGSDNMAIIWSIPTGTIIKKLNCENPGLSSVYDNLVLLATTKGKIITYNMDRRTVARSFQVTTTKINAMVIVSDKLYLATARTLGDYIPIQEWDPQEGVLLAYLETLRAQDRETTLLTGHGRILFGATSNALVILWNLKTKTPVSSISTYVGYNIRGLIYQPEKSTLYFIEANVQVRSFIVDEENLQVNYNGEITYNVFPDIIYSAYVKEMLVFTGARGQVIFYNTTAQSINWQTDISGRWMALCVTDRHVFVGGEDAVLNVFSKDEMQYLRLYRLYLTTIYCVVYDPVTDHLFVGTNTVAYTALKVRYDDGHITYNYIPDRGMICFTLLIHDQKLYFGTAQDAFLIVMYNLKDDTFIRNIEVHSGAVRSLIYSDGFIFSGSDDGTIVVFNSTEMRPIRTLYETQSINQILRAGHMLLVVGLRTTEVLNFYTYAKLASLSTPNQPATVAYHFAHGIFIGDTAGYMYLFDTEFNGLLFTWHDHDNGINSMFVKDNYLYTAGLSGQVRRYDLDRYPAFAERKSYAKQDFQVNAVLSFNGTDVYSGLAEGTLNKFDSRTGMLQAFFTSRRFVAITSMTYDHNYIYAGTNTTFIMAIDRNTLQGRLMYVGHQGAISAVHYSILGLLSGSVDKRILLWNGNADVIAEFIGHNSTITSIVVVGSIMFSAGDSYVVHKWNTKTGKIVQTFSHHQDLVTCMVYYDGLMYSGSRDRTIVRWDPETGNVITVYRRTFTVMGHVAPILSIDLCDNVLFSSSGDGKVMQWSLDRATVSANFDGHLGAVNSISCSNKTLFTGSDDGVTYMWYPNFPPAPRPTTTSSKASVTTTNMKAITDAQESSSWVLIVFVPVVIVSLSLTACLCMYLLRLRVIDVKSRESAQKSTSPNETHSSGGASNKDPAATLFPTHLGIAKPAYLEIRGKEFEVQRQIGKGGGGSVFIGVIKRESEFYGKSESEVVVKIIADSYEKCPTSQQLTFDQELTVMTILQEYKNIARLIAFCHRPCCMVMKYYPLGALDKWIYSPNKDYTTDLVSLFLADIAAGLECMHERWLAHCDIKPQNILIDFDTTQKRNYCVLTDFGITNILSDKIVASQQFNVTNLRGMSARYASPEAFKRFKDRTFDRPSVMKAGDVYSLGVLIGEMISRVVPWKLNKKSAS